MKKRHYVYFEVDAPMVMTREDLVELITGMVTANMAAAKMIALETDIETNAMQLASLDIKIHKH